MARDLLLLAATGDPATSAEQAVDRVLCEALDAFPILPPEGGAPAWAVRWGVCLLDRVRAPCLLAAASQLLSATDTPGQDDDRVLPRVVRDVDRSLAAHGSPRRVRRVVLGSAPERPLLVAITDAQLGVLARAGRLQPAPGPWPAWPGLVATIQPQEWLPAPPGRPGTMLIAILSEGEVRPGDELVIPVDRGAARLEVIEVALLTECFTQGAPRRRVALLVDGQPSRPLDALRPAWIWRVSRD